jgi:hypothetical protein
MYMGIAYLSVVRDTAVQATKHAIFRNLQTPVILHIILGNLEQNSKLC